MKIYMIRHCESEDDILNCYGGCADFDLTERGINAAKEHSSKLANLGINKIFTSPYKRAKGVAKIFADKIGCDIEIVHNLREINTYGVMSGVNKDRANDIFSLLLNSEEYKSYGYYKGKSFYGGEPVEEFDERIKQTFYDVVEQNNDVVAIITHGGVFRSTYKNVLEQPEKILELDDLATIEIEYNGENFEMMTMSGITTEKETSTISKRDAKELCALNNIHMTGNVTFASKNSTAPFYWANPNTKCLSSDWWLLLNDYKKRELHVFHIPANSIKGNHLKYKNVEQIDLQIHYGDQYFEDSRSDVKFKNWLVDTIAY